MTALDWPAVTAILGVVALVLEWSLSRRRDGLGERLRACEARLDALEKPL